MTLDRRINYSFECLSRSFFIGAPEYFPAAKRASKHAVGIRSLLACFYLLHFAVYNNLPKFTWLMLC